MDRYWASYPHTQLQASGEAVGLPRGEDGNTETGHLNLGAGRIVYQELERINMVIADGSFFENETLISAFKHAAENKSNIHLMGLVGAGGVHSNIEHLFALIQLAKRSNISNLYLHLFTDGRDSPPTSARTYIEKVKEVIKKEGIGKIATIMGRYWAMDRDLRWDRTARAYLALTKGLGSLVQSPEEAIEKSYAMGNTDEFIAPYIICNEKKKPLALISDNDAVIFFNFRIDRPRQLTKAFVLKDFSEASVIHDFDPHKEKYEKTNKDAKHQQKIQLFKRGEKIKNLFFASMTEYSKSITNAGVHPAFPPEKIYNPLGAILSATNIGQLRITESEKERFVTYYFNGLREKPYSTEDRVIIPSHRVPTYDQKPEMSSKELTAALIKKLDLGKYGFILVNYPNADMVGHTGNIKATVKAIEAVDQCVGQIASYVLSHEGGVLLITADHGNAEKMMDPQTNQPHTAHTSDKVPFIYVGRKAHIINTDGALTDIAPTMLYLLGIKQPKEMTGRSLVKIK